MNKASHQVSRKGSDKSGLGCWAWTQYQGKEGISLREVVAYCPHDKGGNLSVYNRL